MIYICISRVIEKKKSELEGAKEGEKKSRELGINTQQNYVGCRTSVRPQRLLDDMHVTGPVFFLWNFVQHPFFPSFFLCHSLSTISSPTCTDWSKQDPTLFVLLIRPIRVRFNVDSSKKGVSWLPFEGRRKKENDEWMDELSRSPAKSSEIWRMKESLYWPLEVF